jgi:hypothetical protein
LSGPAPAPDPDLFRRLNRDLYIPAGDRGFWQGAFRDPAEPDFALARDAIAAGNVFSIDVLYGDGEGGQRTITRFTVIESRDGNWITAVSHHWNLDRPDPR